MDPDPQDPYVFGPPGSASGFVSHKTDPAPDPPSSSKIVRKPFISVLLFDFFDFFMTFYQCSGSASGSRSVCFWASRIRVRIHTKMSRIHNSTRKCFTWGLLSLMSRIMMLSFSSDCRRKGTPQSLALKNGWRGMENHVRLIIKHGLCLLKF